MYSKKISKEDLEKLPTVAFNGNVVVVNTVEEAIQAVDALRASGAMIGFDTETRPSFQKGVTHRVALVQLSAGKTCYLFRLCKMKTLEPLKEFLEDSNVVKVGLSTHDDFKNLNKWMEIHPKGFIELQSMITSYGIAELSLAKIYAILFGKKISKRQRLSNWENPILTDRQMSYAALDAVACVDIYKELTLMGKRIISQGSI